MALNANLEQALTNAASGLSAQSIRINTIASNMANASSVGSSQDTTYRSKTPIFSQVTSRIPSIGEDDMPTGGVKVTGVQESSQPLERRYEPSHPLADQEGFVYATDVNQIFEMTNMIEASKEYQANVEIMNTTKNMMAQAVSVINSRE